MSVISIPRYDWRTILKGIVNRRRALMQSSYGAGQSAVVDGSAQGAAETYGARAIGGAASWWLSGGIAAANAIAAYQPKGAASLATSYSNLSTPGTYDAAPGVAPTWDAVNGWTGDGGSKWLETGIAPGNNWSMIVRFTNATAGNRATLGSFSPASKAFSIWPYQAAGVVYFFGGSASGANTAPQMVSGSLAIAGTACYRDGIVDTGAVVDGGGGGVTTINILRMNGLGLYFAGSIQAVAIYDTAITAPQVLAVHTAMAAL